MYVYFFIGKKNVIVVFKILWVIWGEKIKFNFVVDLFIIRIDSFLKNVWL